MRRCAEQAQLRDPAFRVKTQAPHLDQKMGMARQRQPSLLFLVAASCRARE